MESSTALAPRASVVLAVGMTTSVDPEMVLDLAATIDSCDSAELFVVDDMCSEHLRGVLAGLRAKVRVLHSNPAYGTRDALSVATRLSSGKIVILTAPDVEFDQDLLEGLIVKFADNPGVGIVVPTVSYSVEVDENTTPRISPIIAIRRNALDSVGGATSLCGGTGDSEAKGPLVSNFLLEKLKSSGWKQAEVPNKIKHPDGLIDLWPRDPLSQLSARERPYWIPPFHTDNPQPGINVVGLLEAACGVGTAGRRYVEAIAKTDIAYGTFSYHGHQSPELKYEHHNGDSFAFDTNLLVINPDLLLSLCIRGGHELWSANRYTIGVWFWELEQLSPTVKKGFAYVNEIWAASQFMNHAFSGSTDKPVVTIPLPIMRRDGIPTRSKSDLGLPNQFTFLSIFDFGSIAERKNSLGTVRAFCQAFAPDEGPILVLKTLNSSWDLTAWQELQATIGSRRDIRILNGYVEDEVISEMAGAADCFVSLHRAEGFGLTPAEAMAWGRPVIATAYSGNLDFMNDKNSFLVPFEFSHVHPRYASIYPSGARWAEPRLDVAARHMRFVYDNPDLAAIRGRLAQRDIRRTHSLETVSAVIATRMDEIARLRGRLPSSPATSQQQRQLPSGIRRAS